MKHKREHMKTLRLMGTAMLAFFMCVNLTSCGEENIEGGEGENAGNTEGAGIALAEGKRLLSVYSTNDQFEFEYDENGRLKSARYYERSNGQISHSSYTKNCKFTWHEDKIEVVENEDLRYTLNVVDGLVRTTEYENDHDLDEEFSYNKDNRVRTTRSYPLTKYNTWRGDTLVSIENDYPEYVAELTYANGLSCKAGYFPLIPDMIGFGCEALFTAHPELVGMRTNILPDTFSPESGKVSFTYKFNEEGYITTIKEKNDRVTYTYTLTWQE